MDERRIACATSYQRCDAVRSQLTCVNPCAVGSGLHKHRGTISALQAIRAARPKRKVVSRKRRGIDDEQIALNLPGNEIESRLSHAVCNLLNLGILLLRFEIHQADAAAGDDVVELVEAGSA